METKIVKIDQDIYELTAVTCDISGAISIELISNLSPLVISLFDGDIELLNREMRASINHEKLMRMFIELINPMVLKKNGSLVNDWKVEFARKPLTLFRLGYEALRFNCEDFFTFTSGFVKEKINGTNWLELIKNLEKEGAEIPPIFSLLMENGELKTEEVPQKV